VEVRTDAGQLLVFDSGTGIREFGLHLLRSTALPATGHIFLGHTHWDHIAGFPFFPPAFISGNAFTVYGAGDVGHSLESALAGQMQYQYFPVPLRDLSADISFQELEAEGDLRVGDAVVRTQYLNHTAVCLGYRVEADGAAVAYITDHEPFGDVLASDGLNGSTVARGLKGGQIHDRDRRLIDFVRGVDLLIQDAQYTPEEYPSRVGWGHGSTDYVTDLAVAAGVGRLALFHHEPTHSDAQIDAMVTFCQERVRASGSKLDVFAAAEGQQLYLWARSEPPARFRLV
jgi:phosphoribosyl 1,2-cyclic phosphodiesterase